MGRFGKVQYGRLNMRTSSMAQTPNADRDETYVISNNNCPADRMPIGPGTKRQRDRDHVRDD